MRAHGSIDQAALDRLSEGVTIDGVDYLGIEAKLDREQGSNAWLTMGLREGKNREIKKILEHLGLAVNRLIRVSFGPFELGDLPEGEVMEVRTRVLRDQLGVKLAKEAGANFDAPQIVADRAAARAAGKASGREASAGRASRGPSGEPGRPDVERAGARIGSNGTPRRAARRRPSTPERRRKHVSALRAEIAADAATTRKRVERSATHDRKGRTIAVERMSRAGEEARTRGAPEARPKRAGRPNLASAADVHSSQAAAPVGATPSGPSEGEPPEGASGRRVQTEGTGRRPERSSARAEGGRASAALTVPGESEGDRRDSPSRTRERRRIRRASAEFDRPQGRRVIEAARAARRDRMARGRARTPLRPSGSKA